MKTKHKLLVGGVLFLICQQFTYGDKYSSSTIVKTGTKAPDFACETFSLKVFTLNKEKGNVVFVYFFHPGCRACVWLVPKLNKQVYKQFKSNPNFKFIAISRGSRKSSIRKMMKEKKISFPVAYDRSGGIYKKYASKYIPRCYLIGKDGVVKYEFTGTYPAELKKMVKAIEKELAENNDDE